MKVLSWINVILGAWMIVAGFVLSTGSTPVMAEQIIIGIIIAVFALGATRTDGPLYAWLVFIAGVWTVLAPAVIRYGVFSASRMNDVLVGIAVLALGFADAAHRQLTVGAHA